MSAFWAFSWVLIPLAGILAGAFKEWLQFKEKQNQLGTSTEKLEKKVEELMSSLDKSESQKAALVERIQNLETIVTSQEWDALEPSLVASKKPSSNTTNKSRRIDIPLVDETDPLHTINQAAQLAKRLGT